MYNVTPDYVATRMSLPDVMQFSRCALEFIARFGLGITAAAVPADTGGGIDVAEFDALYGRYKS